MNSAKCEPRRALALPHPNAYRLSCVTRWPHLGLALPVASPFSLSTLAHSSDFSRLACFHESDEHGFLVVSELSSWSLTIHSTNLGGFEYSLMFHLQSVIIQKSIFRIFHGYSIFLVMSFRDCNAQYSEILNYRSFLFMLNIIRVFFIFGILVYSRRSSMYAASVTLLQTLRQWQLHAMQGFILYYGFHLYGFLWVSSALLRNWKELLSIISPGQLTIYYSKWVSLLKFWQYSFISRHQVSIIMAPSEDIYGRKCSNL